MEQVTIPRNVLAELFKKQNELLTLYIEIEGLPQPPINLELKKSQKLLRDFLGRVVEELGEAFDCLVKAYTAAALNNNIPGAQAEIVNFNEELADATHFLMELLIYSDFTADSLEMDLRKLFSNMGFESNHEDRPLKAIFDFNIFSFGNEVQKYRYASDSFKIFSIEEAPYLGVRNISWAILEEHAKSLWMITYELNKGMNELKNKDWKQTDKSLNLTAFREQILRGLIAFGYYLELCNIGEGALYINYINKNKINHARIKDKY